MTKKLTPWEKQFRSILRDMRAGRIILNSDFHYVDIDGLTLLVRGDLCPVGYLTSCIELLGEEFYEEWKKLVKP